MKFSLETGVPLPKKKMDGLPNDLRETMRDMKPGQSFLVLINKVRRKGTIQTAFQTVRKEPEFADRVFRSATVTTPPPSCAPGIRIWEQAKPPTVPTQPTQTV